MAVRSVLRSFVRFSLWSILFSVAYTQSPLYTSNQNTYFLHGFACADIGYLRQDWLANSRDATPLFSSLVCATLRFLRWEGWFYVFYALFLGGYFASLYQLAQRETDLSPRARKLAFLALFFLLHSAGWRFVLSRLLGAEWAYAFEGGLANQRLLGTVFQPSVFGVLLLGAIPLALQRKTSAAMVMLALATWFHPTYLLAATLLACGILVTNLVEWLPQSQRRLNLHNLAIFLRPLLLYLLLIAPAALYALSFSISKEISREVAEQGRLILYTVRIPHHADPSVWFNASSVFQIALMFSAPFLTRQKALRSLLGVSLLLATLLTLTVVITRDSALALLFPWRVSVILLPISVTILLGCLVEIIPSEKETPENPWLVWILPSICTAFIALTLLVGWVRISLDFQRHRMQPERRLLEYVAQHKQPQDLYLTPLKMEAFRLATGAPVYVDFKSTPYDPRELIEWQRRYQIAKDFLESPACEKLPPLMEEGISHLILPASQSLACAVLETRYSDEAFQLLQIHPAP